MDISVIIPTHNNATTIEKAVRSVMEQSFTGEYEVCLALDNCTDNTVDVIKKLQSEFPNIVYTEVDVRGDLRSRMAALSISKGKYIMFLDGDDYYHKDALKVCYNKMEDTGADILNFSLFYMTKKKTRPSKLGKNATYDRYQAVKAFFADISYRGFMATKVFKRELLDRIGFSYSGKMMIYMDSLYNFLAICHCEKAVSINSPLYYYNKTNENAQTARGNKRIFDNLSVRANMRKYCEEKGDKRLLSLFRGNKFRIKLLMVVDFALSSFSDKKEKRRIKRQAKKELSLIYGKKEMPRDGYTYSKSLEEIGFNV